MTFGINIVLLYIGGAMALGFVAWIYSVQTKNQAKTKHQRMRRLRRSVQEAR
jgi:hypothetical protein